MTHIFVNLNMRKYFPFYLVDICKTSSSKRATAHYLPSLPLLFLIAVHTILPFYLKKYTVALIQIK